MTESEVQAAAHASLGDAVAAQTEQVTRLAGAAERIPASLGNLERSLNRYRRIYKIIAVIVIAFMLAVGLGVLRLNSIASGNRSIQKQNQRVLDYIADCTNPQGKCSQQGSKRVEKAVQEIINELNKRLPAPSPTPTP